MRIVGLSEDRWGCCGCDGLVMPCSRREEPNVYDGQAIKDSSLVAER